ncbi:MAG: hypothetical protein ACKOPN_00625 [Prochlorococcaceae cyanobacterium]
MSRPDRCSAFAGVAAVGGLALAGLCWPASSSALLRYSAEGASISGSLGGIAFTDAVWSLVAQADEALARNTIVPIGPPGSINLWWLPASPQVTIRPSGGSGELRANLLPQGSFGWIVGSGTFPVGPSPKIGFVYTTATFTPETAAGVFGVPGLYTDLQSPLTGVGPSWFEVGSYPTSAGTLVIASATTAPGAFRIQSVPAPLPLLGWAAAVGFGRRLRQRMGCRRLT